MTIRKLVVPGVNPGGVDKLYGEDWNRLVDSLTGQIAEDVTLTGKTVMSRSPASGSVGAATLVVKPVDDSDPTWPLFELTNAAGNSARFRLFKNGAMTAYESVYLQPGKRLYLDGGGDTYLVEESANKVRAVAGGSTGLTVQSGAVSVPDGSKLELTGEGNNDYLQGNASTREVKLFLNNTLKYNFAQTALRQYVQTLYDSSIGTGQIDAILIDQAAPGTSGQRDSNIIHLRGAAYDGSSHVTDWYLFVDEVTNSGGSRFLFKSRVDGATALDRLLIHDDGTLEPKGDVRIPSSKKLFLDGGGDTYIVESSSNVVDLYVGGVQMAQVSATHWDYNQKTIRNPKNNSNTAVSGTPKTVEIDIAGAPYYFLVYPASS